jgi:lactate dehydrogenase-like 2-hydroxyacid dehydrogenase
MSLGLGFKNARITADQLAARRVHHVGVALDLREHDIARSGGWNIADCVSRSYDIEGMPFGTIAAGRIGLAVLRRLKPFGLQLHCTDPH